MALHTTLLNIRMLTGDLINGLGHRYSNNSYCVTGCTADRLSQQIAVAFKCDPYHLAAVVDARLREELL